MIIHRYKSHFFGHRLCTFSLSNHYGQFRKLQTSGRLLDSVGCSIASWLRLYWSRQYLSLSSQHDPWIGDCLMSWKCGDRHKPKLVSGITCNACNIQINPWSSILATINSYLWFECDIAWGGFIQCRVIIQIYIVWLYLRSFSELFSAAFSMKDSGLPIA